MRLPAPCGGLCVYRSSAIALSGIILPDSACTLSPEWKLSLSRFCVDVLFNPQVRRIHCHLIPFASICRVSRWFCNVSRLMLFCTPINSLPLDTTFLLLCPTLHLPVSHQTQSADEHGVLLLTSPAPTLISVFLSPIDTDCCFPC